MLKRAEHRRSFKAVDDAGREYVIHEYVDIIDVSSYGEPNATKEGIRRLTTGQGGNVNYLAKGEYQIVSTGVRVRSQDPNAP